MAHLLCIKLSLETFAHELLFAILRLASIADEPIMLQDKDGQVVGVNVKDLVGRKSHDVYAREVDFQSRT